MGLLDDWLNAKVSINPVSLAWGLLPQNVRDTYTSGARALLDTTTPASIRDYTTSAQDTARSVKEGDGWGTATNALATVNAALGAVPVAGLGVTLARKGAQEVGQAVGKGAAKTIRAYHGSPNSFDRFLLEKAGSTTDPGDLGRAIYAATDPRVGASQAHRYEVAITPKNPLEIALPNFRTHKSEVIRQALGLPPNATAREISEAALAKGHDAAILDYSPTGYNHKEIAAYDERIVEILRKYGLLPVAGAGAAMAVPGLLSPSNDEVR